MLGFLRAYLGWSLETYVHKLTNKAALYIMVENTMCPSNMRTFYLQMCIFDVAETIPRCGIQHISTSFPALRGMYPIFT